MFRRITVLLGLIVVFLAMLPSARACSCALGDPRRTLQQSSAAFIGTVLESPLPIDPALQNYVEEVTWKFKVDEAVKGDLGPVVDIQTPAQGSACGFGFSKGDKSGIFLTRHGDTWTSSLCATISPAELRAAAKSLPAPNGIGPVAFLVGGSFGEARTMALDDEGRTLNYGVGSGVVTEISLCPGSKRFAELVSSDDDSARTTSVAVRNTDALDLVWEKVAPSFTTERVDGLHALTISCRDPTGGEVLVFASNINASGTDGRVLRVTPTGESTVWRGNARAGAFAASRGSAYLAGNSRLFELDISSATTKDVADVPSRYAYEVVLSPDERKVTVLSILPDGQPRLFAIELSSRAITQQEDGVRGFVVWIDNDRLLMYGNDELETVELFESSLKRIGSWKRWPGGDSVVREGMLYSASHGQMRSASALTGGLKILRTFESPNQFALVALTTPIETTRHPVAPSTPSFRQTSDNTAGTGGLWAAWVAAAAASIMLVAAIRLRLRS